MPLIKMSRLEVSTYAAASGMNRDTDGAERNPGPPPRKPRSVMQSHTLSCDAVQSEHR